MIRGGMQDWPLRVHTILDHAERMHGAREVVTRTIEGPIHRTNYAEVSRRARQLSSALKRLGVEEGDRIGTHLETWYGIAGVGAIYHTLNPRLAEEQIAFIVNDADDRMIFTDLTFVPHLEKWRDSCVGKRPIIVMTDRAHMPESSLDLICYEELVASGDPEFAWAQVPETAPVGLCYTSGTTGNPKGVIYTHRSNVLQSLTVQSSGIFQFSPLSSILPIVPMFHANAWSLAFSAPMTGAKLVMPGAAMDGPSICQLLRDEGVTFSAGVPTVWMGAIEEMRANGKPDKLERVIIGGSAAPEWMIVTLEKEFGIEVMHAWGMTEMSPVGSVPVTKPEMAGLDEAARLQLKLKQGAAFYGVEMRIADEEGKTLPNDGETAGRLLVKGPAVVGEYFKGAGGNILDADGWFDTGDLATIDRYGYMQITDRTKDVIKSGGEWISSVELENIASGHDDVIEAAAIAIPDERWSERPMVLAVLKPGSALTADQLRDYLRPRVAKYWLPEQIRFVDSLPHTATGKLDKKVMRQLYGGVMAQ